MITKGKLHILKTDCGKVRIVAEDNENVASTGVPQVSANSEDDAAELVRRWNAYDDLLAACVRIKERCDTGGLIDKDTTGLYNCVKFAILAAES